MTHLIAKLLDYETSSVLTKSYTQAKFENIINLFDSTFQVGSDT